MAQWNVTDAVYLQEFSVAARDNSPQDVIFKPDGTKMYVIGSQNDSVYEYDLGVQWDVSSAVYLQEFSVAAKETVPSGVYFKPDGTKMYTAGASGASVDEYDLGTQWDVSTAVYLQEFSVALQETSPRDVTLKPDGTKMYILGHVGKKVYEYDLGMQWDVSTAVFLQEYDVSAKELSPRGVFFKPDGTKMFTIGFSGDTVDEYDLGVQWDVSTAVYLREISVRAKEIEPMDVFFKPDGTKMYTVGTDGDTVDEYDL